MLRSSTIHDGLSAIRHEVPVHDAIADLDVEVGHDWTGDDAVWIWVVFRDDHMAHAWSTENRDALRDRIRDLVRAVARPAEVQVYVRFRSETEHRGVIGEAWAG